MFDHSQHSTGNALLEGEGESKPAPLWQFAEDIAGALLNPSQTFQDVGRREAIIPAMALIVLIMIIGSSGQVATLLLSIGELGGLPTNMAGPGTGTVAAMQLTGLLWSIVWAPVIWTILAGLLYGIGYALGGRGRFASLWATTGFAFAPQLLVAPLGSVNDFAGAIGVGWQLLGAVVVLPVTIAAFFWSMALLVIAVRTSMNLTTGRAIGTVATLVGGVLFIGVLLACLFLLLIFALAAAIAA